MSYDKCPVHDTDTFLFCETCSRFACHECFDCKNHLIRSKDGLVYRFREAIDGCSLEDYKTKALAALHEKSKMIEKVTNEISQTSELAEKLRYQSPPASAREKHDLDLVGKAINDLRKVGEQAETNALKESVAKAIMILDIDDEIAKEIRGHKTNLDLMNDRMSDYTLKLKTLKAQEAWLKTIRDSEVGVEDKSVELALALSFSCELIKPTPEVTSFHGNAQLRGRNVAKHNEKFGDLVTLKGGTQLPPNIDNKNSPSSSKSSNPLVGTGTSPGTPVAKKVAHVPVLSSGPPK